MKTAILNKIFISICLLLTTNCLAQYNSARFAFEQPVTNFSMDEYGNSYIVNSASPGYINITKLDTANNLVWTKDYWNATNPDAMIAVKYGKVYLAYNGQTVSQISSGLMQIDYDGNLMWLRTFEHTIGINDTSAGPVLGGICKILITPTQVASVWIDNKTTRVLNYDNNGNLNYQTSFRNDEVNQHQLCMNAILTSTGNIMIVGRGGLGWFGCSVRMSTGNINWHHVYIETIAPNPYPAWGEVNCIEQLDPNKFIIGGNRNNADHSTSDRGFYSYMDSSGNILSNYEFLNNTVNSITRIKKLDDGKLHLDILLNDTTEPSPGVFSSRSRGYSSMREDSLNRFYALVDRGPDAFSSTLYIYPHFRSNKYYYIHKQKYFVAENIYNTCTDFEPFKIEAIEAVYNYAVNPNYYIVPNVSLNPSTIVLLDDLNAPVIDCGNFIGFESTNTLPFSIYPNPAENFFIINTAEDLGSVSIYIYNMQGQLVKASALNGSNLVDVSELSNGMYFYRLISNNQVINQDKLIIRK